MKVAGPDAKKMFALFEATGIFTSFCRHGHMLISCDMVRSGELYVFFQNSFLSLALTIFRMKYPLAIVEKLLKVHGSDVCVGYDIVCSFSATLKSSSLGAEATAARLRCVVPAFHGYAHSRSCQVKWHPLNVEGTGKEDFEGSEHAFSASNALAVGTRLSSRFHRAQALQQHWDFWSADKYAQSGNLFHSLSPRLPHPSPQDYSFSTTTNKPHQSSAKPCQHLLYTTAKLATLQPTLIGLSSKSRTIWQHPRRTPHTSSRRLTTFIP